jgi:26S proteasome regulatory subunit N13
MNADQIIPIVMSNQSIIDRLLPLLPEERRNVAELQDVLRSPQFHQSLDAFAHALQSGQLGEMLRQFGIQSQALGQPTS